MYSVPYPLLLDRHTHTLTPTPIHTHSHTHSHMYTHTCTHIHTDHTYEYLVESQPIGDKLFCMFCQKDPQLARCTDFIQRLEELKVVADEKCAATAQRIYDEYISLEVSQD